MTTIFKLSLAALLFSSHNALALVDCREDSDSLLGITCEEKIEETYDAFKEQVSQLDPIPFQAIVLRYENGERIATNHMLTIEKEVAGAIAPIEVSVGELEMQLNQMEKQLNQLGRSLREDAKVFGALTRFSLDEEKMKIQSQLISKGLREFDPLKMQLQLKEEEFKKKLEDFKNKKKQEIEEYVKSLVDSSEESIDIPKIEIPSILEFKPLEIPEFKADKERNWTFTKGNPKNFLVYGNASIKTMGDAGKTKEARGQGEAELGVSLFGLRDQKIIQGYANFNAPQIGDQTFGVVIQVLKYKILNEPKLTAPSITLGESFKKGTDLKKELNFTIGFVPCIVTIGIRGEVYFNYSLGIKPLTAFVRADAGGLIKGYAQAQATIVVAGVGVEAELVLIEKKLSLRGDAKVVFDDDLIPSVVVDINGDNDTTMLSGRMYAFAYAYVPQCTKANIGGIPYPKCSISKKRADHVIYDNPGIVKKGKILSLHMTLSPVPGKSKVSGADLKSEDVEQILALRLSSVKLDSQLTDNKIAEMKNELEGERAILMTGIANDLQSEAAIDLLETIAENEQSHELVQQEIWKLYNEL